MTPPARTCLLAAAAVLAAAGLPGCATTESTRARSLQPTAAAGSLVACRHLTVAAFALPTGKRVDPGAGRALAVDIERRLKSDFGPLFESVALADAPRNVAGECLLGGEISKYRKGSKVARFIVMGLGSASLEGRVTVTDPAGATLLEAPFDKLWAWGGIAGASKGIEDMGEEVGASIAATVARAKGWTPPVEPAR